MVLSVLFSHNWNCKLPEYGTPVNLGELARINPSETIKTPEGLALLRLDTGIWAEKDIEALFRKFSAWTDALLLTFHTKTGRVFTTIRRWTPDKQEYYWRNIGSLFEVVLTEGTR